jgi:hypothetical protein
MQHAHISTWLQSSGYCSAGGFLVTEANLWQVATAFTARLAVKKTWLNDRDQFLAPREPLPDEFATDCLLWMLFHNQNLTASADGIEWNGRDWSLVNHFIPYAEDEVGSPDAFESDSFAACWLRESCRPKRVPYWMRVVQCGVRIFAKGCAQRARTISSQSRRRGLVSDSQRAEARDTLDASGMPALVAAHGALGDKLRPLIFDYDMLLT